MQSQKKQTVSLGEAAQQSPVLSRLHDLIRQSQLCMEAVMPYLPMTMRSHVSSGPIDIEQNTWCILAHNNAVASKLRQLKPDLEAIVKRQPETSVEYIRIRVVSLPMSTTHHSMQHPI